MGHGRTLSAAVTVATLGEAPGRDGSRLDVFAAPGHRRTKRRSIWALLALSLGSAVLAASPVSAVASMDQSVGAVGYFGFLAGPVYLPAQTFTAGISGTMEQIELPLGSVGGQLAGVVTVTIVDMSSGDPFSGVVLATETFDASTITSGSVGLQWVSVSLDPAVSVASGTQYAIVVAYTTSGPYLLWNYAGSNYYTSYYAGGVASSLDFGQVVSFGGDLGFRTYVALVDTDSDDDGIDDARDPDAVAVVVEDASTAIGSGNRKAFLDRLEGVEMSILTDDVANAVRELQALRKRTDGCGNKPDNNDWVLACDDQQVLRAMIDALVANLQV